MRQHRLVVRHRNADVEKPDHLSGRVHDRVVGRHERLAEQRRRSPVSLAATHDRLSGVVGRELGADGAVAVLLLDVGGAANELVAGLVIDEQGRVAAGVANGAVDDRMVLELGHLGNFGAGDGPVLDRDLGVAIGLGKRAQAGGAARFSSLSGRLWRLGARLGIAGDSRSSRPSGPPFAR